MPMVRNAVACVLLLISIVATAQEWGLPKPLYSYAGFPPTTGINFSIATNGGGRWMTLWEGVETSGRDIFGLSLYDLQPVWGPVRRVNGNFALTGDNDNPSLAVSGNRWIAVWESRDTRNGTIGTDKDLLYAFSTNNGATWSSPAVLNSYAGTDSVEDLFPAIAAGSNGTVIVAWETTFNFGGTVGDDLDIAYAVSHDGGVTFSAAAPLPSSASADQSIDSDRLPAIATDGAGTWVVCWESFADLGSFGSDYDIFYVRSTNNGATWSSTNALHPNATSDGGASDNRASIASDGKGTWIAAWESGNALSNTIETDLDILFSRSIDGGVTWSSPAPVNTTATPPQYGSDSDAKVATDKRGNFLVVWLSSDAPVGQTYNNTIVSSVSSNAGATWSDPQPLVPGSNGQYNPALAVGRDGIATVVWNDTGEYYIRTVGYGAIRGRVSDGTQGIPCAAVEVVSLDQTVSRVVAVDSRGDFQVEGLPDGLYTVTAHASGYTSASVEKQVVPNFFAPALLVLTPRPVSTYHVSGVASDFDTGAAMSAAQVTVEWGSASTETTVTCATGAYEAVLDLPGKGDSILVLVTFSQPGYATTSTVAGVSPGIDATINGTLLKAVSTTGNLGGTITEAGSNAPVSGATVEVTGFTGQSLQTGGDGSYLFTELPSGVYTVRASAPGFQTEVSGDVAVNADGVAQFSAALRPVSALGSVNVSLTPAAAVNLGAGWRFAGELAWRTAEAVEYDSGTADIEFRPVDGYRSPASRQVAVASSTQTAVSGFYRLPADVNADGLINAVDVQATINTALGVSSFDADVNGDGVVNAVDIQLVINAALGVG